jgi:hypothetical protein
MNWRHPWTSLVAVLLAGCVSRSPVSSLNLEGELPLLLCFTNAAAWTREVVTGNRVVLASPLIRTREAWDQVVVSWNIEPAAGAGLVVEARLPSIPEADRAYNLGSWSLDGRTPIARTSMNGQADALAEVRTDTLVAAKPTHVLQLRLTLLDAAARHPERLRLVASSFWNSGREEDPRVSPGQAPGRSLNLPEISQISYPGGEGWCSPTAMTMVLGWWATVLSRPELHFDVPEVASGVHDPGWPGTGNWPFNTAFAGSLPGIVACVTRLPDLRAVEELVSADIPVVLSVNPPVLRGKQASPEGGHLIVCVGFTDSGDCVVHDPWARTEQGERVRRVYGRENLERAWRHSGRLAYLVAPREKARLFPASWQ